MKRAGQNPVVKIKKHGAGVSLALILMIGLVFILYIVHRTGKEMRTDLLTRARLVSQGVNRTWFASLSGTERDLGTDGYLRLKGQLASARDINDKCRFVYLMGKKKTGEVFFYVDSEPAGSADESTAGQIYEEIPSDILSVFEVGRETTVGPVTDRWGSWITALVPLVSSESGELIAVLGMDVDARTWAWDVAGECAVPVGLILVVLIFAVAGLTKSQVANQTAIKPVQRRLLMPLTVFLVVVVGGFGVILLFLQQANLKQLGRQRLDVVTTNMQRSLQEQAQALSAVERILLANENLISAFKAQDRQRLLDDWQVYFDHLKNDYGVTQFGFHRPDRTNLLRVHKPERYGDLINRVTILEAEAFEKKAAGIELGPLGMVTLRVVQPVIDNGNLVGYLELGKEVGEIFTSVVAERDLELAVAIRKSGVQREMWEMGMKMLGRETNWDRFDRDVIIYSSMDRFPAQCEPYLQDEKPHDYHRLDEVKFDGKLWWVLIHPLRDLSGREIGDIYLFQDTTKAIARFNSVLLIAGSGVAVFLAALICFLHIFLKRIDRGIQQQQEELADSESRYRVLVENAPEAILVFNVDTLAFVDANDNAERLFGLPRGELLKVSVADMSPEYQADGRSTQQVAAEKIYWMLEGDSQTFEWTHLNKATGEEVYCEVRLVVLPPKEKRLGRASIVDITERKRVETALRESESRLRESQRMARIGNWYWDVKTGEVDWSDEVYRIFQLDPEKFTPQIDSVMKLSPWPEDARRHQELMEKAIKNREPGYFEQRFLLPDGSTGYYTSTFQGIYGEDGDLLAIKGTVQDSTKAKTQEAELKRLRNYLSNIIDSMPSILIGVDSKGNVTQWNTAAEKLTGVSADTAQGKALEEVFPRLQTEMSRISESIRTRRILRQEKTPIHTGEGIRLEDMTIFPLVSNGVEGAVVRIDDVTERVRLEEMMIQSEKMLSVGGLAAGMAHEINNPLAGMMQTADVLCRRLTSKDIIGNLKSAEEVGISMDSIHAFMDKRGVLRMLESIKESGSRAAGIVKNMLSFARQGEAHGSPQNINELIDKTLDLASTDYDLKKQYDFKTIEVQKQYDATIPDVSCEVVKIQQVILNILRNGAEAMQHGGTDHPRIIIRTGYDSVSKMVCMEIEDNGPGMDEETRKRVFEPFFTTKPVGVGTGLGLSVSYFIVAQNHGGEMEVESQPGSGSTFIVRLPIEEKQG